MLKTVKVTDINAYCGCTPIIFAHIPVNGLVTLVQTYSHDDTNLPSLLPYSVQIDYTKQRTMMLHDLFDYKFLQRNVPRVVIILKIHHWYNSCTFIYHCIFKDKEYNFRLRDITTEEFAIILAKHDKKIDDISWCCQNDMPSVLQSMIRHVLKLLRQEIYQYICEQLHAECPTA